MKVLLYTFRISILVYNRLIFSCIFIPMIMETLIYKKKDNLLKKTEKSSSEKKKSKMSQKRKQFSKEQS